MAFKWLKEYAPPTDFVLAAENTSQLVAQKSGFRVYAGHEMETIHYTDKLKQVAVWYQANLPESALEGSGVNWVVYGPYEEQLSPGFIPGDNLVEVFNNAEVTLYQVK